MKFTFTGGGPHLDFEKAMEMDHCSGKGCREYFVTNNYKIRTCPFDEWQITVKDNLSSATSPEATAHDRRFVPIAALMQVDVAVQAKLTRPEVIAVVLYTGPMVSRLFSVPSVHAHVSALHSISDSASPALQATFFVLVILHLYILSNMNV